MGKKLWNPDLISRFDSKPKDLFQDVAGKGSVSHQRLGNTLQERLELKQCWWLGPHLDWNSLVPHTSWLLCKHKPHVSTPTRHHIRPNKNPVGTRVTSFWVIGQRIPTDFQTPTLDNLQNLLVRRYYWQYYLSCKHEKVKWILTWKLHPYWLALLVPEDAVQATPPEKRTHQSHHAVDLGALFCILQNSLQSLVLLTYQSGLCK